VGESGVGDYGPYKPEAELGTHGAKLQLEGTVRDWGFVRHFLFSFYRH
jgi:hypothetical protein